MKTTSTAITSLIPYHHYPPADFNALKQFHFLVYSLLFILAKESCDLGPIPARLLLETADILSPVILQVVNLSLETAFLPPKLKEAMLKPILKTQS